jgi:exodeoxyribonuclease V alpha subunit
MITQNNYRMNLFNGDIGLIWFNKKSKRLVAYFEHSDTSKEELDSSNQQYRQFLPSRLPTFEPVYAMTIHKTQGSEFEHVALILPKLNPTMPVKNDDNQLLSRELLYTGITRAKKRLTICTQKNAWEQGVKARVNRESGLF